MLKLWENPMLSQADQLEAAKGRIEQLEQMLEAAEKHAIERCAKVCDQHANASVKYLSDYEQGGLDKAAELADAIRELGDKA